MGLSPTRHNEYQHKVEQLQSKLDQFCTGVKELDADHEITKRNILILDRQIKELNAVVEILLNLQNQLMEDFIPQGKASQKGISVFPLASSKTEDDEWN
jgi:hypothetical protein